MKTKSVVSALEKVMKAEKRSDSRMIWICYQRQVEVIDQGGNAVVLCTVNGQVRHIGKMTIKNVLAFIVDDLSLEQVDYLKTLRQMYSMESNERRVQMALTYKSLGQALAAK